MDDLQLNIEKLRNKFVPGWLNVIDVDGGWYQLVIDCDKELTELDPDYRVHQIKEKFGKLRYYIRQADECGLDTLEKMNAVIRKYEDVSSITCEATGDPGVLMRSVGGWLKTLSPVYASESLHYARYTLAAPPTDVVGP